MIMITHLPPEQECGNTEYKLKISSNTLENKPKRFEQLKTQMNYRLNEGIGYCLYILGASDQGKIIGLTSGELEDSESNLYKLIKSNSATLINKSTISHNEGHSCCIYIICKY